MEVVPLFHSVNIEITADTLTEEQRRRAAVCNICCKPSSSASHVCPCCSASVCFPCARAKLAAAPRCPSCGDRTRNERPLKEFLAAGETLETVSMIASAASEATGALASRASEATEAFTAGAARASQATGEFASRALSGLGSQGSHGDKRQAPRPPSRSATRQLSGGVETPKKVARVSNFVEAHSCHFCRTASSPLDIACPSCTTTVCLSCAPRHLSNNTCCPHCRHTEFCNPQALRLIQNAAQIRESAENFWQGLVGAGRELLAGADKIASGPGLRCTQTRGSASQAVVVEEVVVM